LGGKGHAGALVLTVPIYCPGVKWSKTKLIEALALTALPLIRAGSTALAHHRLWHLACISFTWQTGGYAIIFWMPQAVKSLFKLYPNTVVGILVMIPFLAGLFATILASRSSDRKLERRYHMAIPLIVAGTALILLSATSASLFSMTLWTFAVMGSAAVNGPLFSLPGDFLTGAAAASGIALVTSIGSLGGFVGPFLVGTAANAQGGIYRGLAIAAVSFFVSATLVVMLPKKVRRASVVCSTL